MILPILLSLILEAGTMPSYTKMLGDQYYSDDIYYQLTKAKIKAFETFYLEASTLTETIKGTSWQFAPVNSTYQIGAGISFGGLTVGAEHSCTHPVISYIDSVPKTMNYFAGYDKLFVRYELEFRP